MSARAEHHTAPHRNLRKSQVQFHEHAAGVIAHREETQSAASAYREAELDFIKLTMQSRPVNYRTLTAGEDSSRML